MNRRLFIQKSFAGVVLANKYAEYKWKEKDVERLIKVIKQQIVPRAEDQRSP